MLINNSAEGLTNLSAAIWKSPFRPFYLAGALYAPLLMIYWLASYTQTISGIDPAYPSYIFHGHEMIFGFAGAIISGFVLTALPSWAGTQEIHGRRLAVLAGLWLLGRLAILLAAHLPAPLVMITDSCLFLMMGIMVAPGLWRAANKVYLVLLLILAALFFGNLLFHVGVITADTDKVTLGLYLGIYAIMLKFTLVAGYLTPIFTSNILEQSGGRAIRFQPALEALSIITLIAFIYSGLFAVDSLWRGGSASAAVLIHSLRLCRWQTRNIINQPIVLVMHLAYGWMIVCFALRAIADFSITTTSTAWLHAFTVGAMGLMMMGLMTRVALRHTGRPLRAGRLLVVGYGLMFVAGISRVSASFLQHNLQLILLSALLWMIPFIIYLKLHGALLVRPSLAKQ